MHYSIEAVLVNGVHLEVASYLMVETVSLQMWGFHLMQRYFNVGLMGQEDVATEKVQHDQ